MIKIFELEKNWTKKLLESLKQDSIKTKEIRNLYNLWKKETLIVENTKDFSVNYVSKNEKDEIEIVRT